MTLKNREIRLSVKDRIKEMFEAPDALSGLSDYNVYTETQYRAAGAGTFTPVFPYIYLMDAFISPVPMRVDLQQPFIVVEVDKYQSKPFEMGNRAGRDIDLMLHVFGKNRGERDDLGGFIADYFGTAVDIKTYPSGVVVEQALVNPVITVRDVFTPRMEKVEPMELSTALLGWSTVSLTIRCKL